MVVVELDELRLEIASHPVLDEPHPRRYGATMFKPIEETKNVGVDLEDSTITTLVGTTIDEK